MSGAFYSADTPESTWAALSGSSIPSVLNAGEIEVTAFLRTACAHIPAIPLPRQVLRARSGTLSPRPWALPLCELLGARCATYPFGRRYRHLRSDWQSCLKG